LGDDSQVSWEEAPEWLKNSVLDGVLLRLNNPELLVSAQHDSWREKKVRDGWIFGEVKDAEKKTHPCLVDFCDLPEEQKAKDFLFKDVVLGLKRILDETCI